MEVALKEKNFMDSNFLRESGSIVRVKVGGVEGKITLLGRGISNSPSLSDNS